MKICFVASIKNKDKAVVDYEEIVKVLKETGDTVFYEHVMGYSQNDLDSLGEEKKIQFHAKVMNLIKKSDVVVAEVTNQSISVGYLISMSLEQSKPTVLLYKGDNCPNIISAIEHSEKILVRGYSEKSSLKKVISEVIEEAKKYTDVRFNFFVSPKILSYLDWIAQKRMIPRSVFLRNLIEREMKKDKEFKT